MIYTIRYSQFNLYSILIEWESSIDEIMLGDVLQFKFNIEKYYIKQKVEVLNTYNSIIVIYNDTFYNLNTEILNLKLLYSKPNIFETIKPSTWKIPVCYSHELAPGLINFSNQKKCSITDIIKLHSEVLYTVFFIGFLPGFLYLGGLNSQLYLDRKKTPNLNVKKGAVAIGGQQTGIYPQDSPGGWHVIGNSPIELFNPSSNPPCYIKAGDKIQFHPISITEYNVIEENIKLSKFDFKSLML